MALFPESRVLDLLTAMSPDRFGRLYARLDPQVARVFDGAIARVLNARPGSVGKLPAPTRTKALRAWLLREKDEAVAGDLLRAYFLGPAKELVVEFLDATGVKHEDGQVEDGTEPDGGRVASAVSDLLEDHDVEDVRLYLQIAARQWPSIEELGRALEELPDPR